ncbi:MAG: hypothetical protein EOP85_08015 [Verrucomicrobiaceae bacterium]|nr:MAG: hypothetical protein EOP85_08015 [Verrucomicrobiaceae bacterium]
MREFLDPTKEIHKHGAILPHWHQENAMQFVTFRLADAMPSSKLRIWKEEFTIWENHHPKPWSPSVRQEYDERFVWKLENWLDEGSGSCLLAEPEFRKFLEETLMHDEGSRVDHHSWVIMPNYVHLLFTARHPLHLLMKSWKGITARKIGRGRIWQQGYRDTMIRDAEHFSNAVRYIRRNPAKLKSGSYTLWESERANAVE